MKIVILGWGSLVWDPRELPHNGPWKNDGPELPIEFSRISSDCRLTLVIDGDNGTLCKTLYTLSLRTSLPDAVNDLMMREGTIEKRIGFYNHHSQECSLSHFPEQVDIRDVLSTWCDRYGIDGVVWTALQSNFDDQISEEFSVERAITYLKGLPKTARKIALEYIQKAPEQIDTPLRRQVKSVWPEYG